MKMMVTNYLYSTNPKTCILNVIRYKYFSTIINCLKCVKFMPWVVLFAVIMSMLHFSWYRCGIKFHQIMVKLIIFNNIDGRQPSYSLAFVKKSYTGYIQISNLETLYSLWGSYVWMEDYKSEWRNLSKNRNAFLSKNAYSFF